MNKKIKIAYLAPEIPALSATFVYQEIIQLVEMGFDVYPVSIHKPSSMAHGDYLKELEEMTLYLYEESFAHVFFANIRRLVISPVRYMKTLSCTISDIFKSGVFTRIGIGLLYRFVIASFLAEYLSKNKINHIHSNFAHIPTDITMYASLLSGVPYSFTSHANDLFERGWLLKEKVNRAKFSVTISDYNKKYLANQGANINKLSVIHCGVNTESFTKRDKKMLSAPYLFGSLGRMVEKKGFDVLISACYILGKKNINFKLEIAGDGPLLSNLEKKVHKLDLNNNIEFIGALSHENVPNWMKTLDAFVLPCKKDSFGDMDGIPVVLMEAMLSGVPVISTSVSGIPELIIHGETGLLSEPDSSEDIANNIVELISNDTLANDMVTEANCKVKNDFELSANTKKLAMLLENNIE